MLKIVWFFRNNLNSSDEKMDVGGMLLELTQKEIRLKNFFCSVYWNFRVRSFTVL